MRLALALGYAKVDRMLSEITAAELTEWIEFFNLEPFGEERADLRMGILASTIANCNRGKSQLPFKPADFMPFAKKKRQTLDEMKAAAMALCAAAGGSFVGVDNPRVPKVRAMNERRQ